MLNIMYHFINDDERLKGITIELFRKQLDYIQSKYSVSTISLTFDHGTIDHLTIVAPELEKRGLMGYFFILTMIPEENKLPAIDKQRFLEAKFRMELAKIVCDELKIEYTPKIALNYLQEFDHYSLEERYLRYLRDKVINSKTYDSLIGKLFTDIYGNETDFCMKEYLGWDHIYQLHSRGHIIGSHSHYHKDGVNDYEKSLKLIKEVIGEQPRYISYPQGNKNISDVELKSLGSKTAYISREQGKYPFRAGRIDCNQLKL